MHCSRDVLGNEYSAILKNIYAIGAGIASGLGYGDNFTAVFVTNAIREMEKFLEGIHETPRDVNESAYLGDLLVTAYSLFSRNRSLGNLIGKGYTVKSAIQSMNMIAEGYYAADSIYNTSKEKKMNTPIIDTIYRILYEGKSAEKQFQKLTTILIWWWIYSRKEKILPIKGDLVKVLSWQVVTEKWELRYFLFRLH